MEDSKSPEHPKPKTKPKTTRRMSMFEEDSYQVMLEERMKDSVHDIVGIEPGLTEEESHEELASVSWKPSSAKLTYANTYRLRPKNKFVAQDVKIKIENILKDKLHNQTYDPSICKSLSKSLAQEILTAVRTMGFDRYKYIAQVIVLEKKCQGIKISSRWLWDTQWDNWASAIFESPTFIVNGLVFAVYYE